MFNAQKIGLGIEGQPMQELAAGMIAMMADKIMADCNGQPYDKTKFNADADKLRGLCDAINHESPLAVGDIVVWKTGLKNRKFPAYGQPVVVTRRHEEPVDCIGEYGTQTFNELLTIACGIIIDGEFLEYHFDSRRFEKVG